MKSLKTVSPFYFDLKNRIFSPETIPINVGLARLYCCLSSIYWSWKGAKVHETRPSFFLYFFDGSGSASFLVSISSPLLLFLVSFSVSYVCSSFRQPVLLKTSLQLHPFCNGGFLGPSLGNISCSLSISSLSFWSS